MSFNPDTYGVVLDDPTQSIPNTAKLNQMVADINSAGYGEVQWPLVGKCALGKIDPIYPDVKWVGSHERASIMVTDDPVADVLTFYGSVKFVDMGMDSSVVKTAGHFINLAGTNNYIPGTTEFVGGNCQIDSVYMSRPYVGIKSTGWWNTVNKTTIRDMTPRSPGSSSGAIWIADAGCTVTKSILGNQIVPGDPARPQDYQADWCIRHTQGEMHLNDVKGFLTNVGVLLDPGAGNTILISEQTNCAMDNVQESAFKIKPTHSTAIIAYVAAHGGWMAPGWAGGASFACVLDNAAGAHVHKLIIEDVEMMSYNNGAGCGIYVYAGPTVNDPTRLAIEYQAKGNQIGGENFAFGTGILVQGGAKKFNIDGNIVSHATVGANIGAGCDDYIHRGTFDSCGTAVIDPNTGGAAIRGPHLIY